MIDKNDTMPLVSVIIPSYNHEKYIEEAIRSVWTQTYHNIELIVIDDGSKDNSVAIINRLSTTSPIPMKVIVKANEGVCKTLNLGVIQSSGKYISFLASDDRYLRDKFDILVPILEKTDDKVAFVYSRNLVISEEGRPLTIASGETKMDSNNLFEDILLFKLFPTLSSSLFKKVILVEVGQFNEKYKFEDLDLMLRLTRNYQALFCNRATFEYRAVSQSFSKNTLLLYKDVLGIFNDNVIYSNKINSFFWRNYAYSRVYSRISESFYMINDFKFSRLWSAKSILKNPFQYKSYRLFVRSLLGKRIVNWFRGRLHQNICCD